MARLSTLDFFVLAIWSLVLSCSAAEREAFPQKASKSWVEARKHCQSCYKELVTLTPENIQSITKSLTTEHWIGLCKRPLSVDNSYLYPYNDTSTFWSLWANGDPLTFQNWYPGYPVFKSPYPKKDCCSCSCTCPVKPTTGPTTPFTTTADLRGKFSVGKSTTVSNSTNSTSQWSTHSVTNISGGATSSAPFTRASSGNTTGQLTSTWRNVSFPNSTTNSTSQWSTHSAFRATAFSTAAPFTHAPVFESECERKPMLFQDVPDPDENYIEDPCVAMLSFGAWVEKNCSELLPYICYEDRFDGIVNVTDIKSASANISWEKGPGIIDHYRVEVNGSVYKDNYTGSSYAVVNLTAGTLYQVQVFPVKCGRDLHATVKTFYTVPNKVTGLKIIGQTEKCVSLTWTKPIGSVDFYSVQTTGHKDPDVIKTENAKVCDLMPGSLHTFSVRSRVNDRSQQSEESTVEAYTKPAQVPILNISEFKDSSLELSWDKPQGNATGYRITTSWGGKQNMSYINETVEDGGENKLSLKDLPSGTKITINIVALANHTLVGQSLTKDWVTEPEDITNLTLTSTKDTITAAWDFAKGSPLFTVELWLEEVLEETCANINKATVTFTKVKSAANYTVTVYSVTGKTNSSGFSKSIITLPNPPRNPKLSDQSKKHLHFSWTPPENTKTVVYLVTLKSSFWGQKWVETLHNQTTYKFDNLKSGTNYTFEVKTLAGDQKSEAVALIAATDSAKREITLSMVCSSQSPLLCESEDTKNSAFRELHFHFQRLLENHVFWELEPPATGK